MFKDTVLQESPDLGAGEIITSKAYVTEAFEHFANGTQAGRFIQAATISIDGEDAIQAAPLDGSATPIIAGVAARKIGSSIESSGVYHADTDQVCEVHMQGFMTVEVDETATPAKYKQVYAVNASGATSGLATDADTGEIVPECIFWEQKAEGVWLIALTKIITPTVAEAAPEV